MEKETEKELDSYEELHPEGEMEIQEVGEDLAEEMPETEINDSVPETELKIINSETGPEPKEENVGSKGMLIMIAIVIGIFILIFVGFYFYNNYHTEKVINVDDLHKENLKGNLDEEEGYIYNGYSFVKVDGLWWTELDRFGTLLKVPLHFDPKEVEEIKVVGKLDSGFNLGEDVYIAIDPKVVDKYYGLAISELSFNIVKGMDRFAIGSCTEESPLCDNRTIVNCNNTNGLPVIELVSGPETKIELKGTCIKLSGNGYNITKAANRLLYQWYGVME